MPTPVQTRFTLIPFGNAGPASSFGQFGSKAAASPQTTQDPVVIQQLAAWSDGWQNAVVAGDKAAYLEDMNGWCFVHSKAVAYIYQMGIPQWDTSTTYMKNSVVQDAVGNGQWFSSLQDNNAGNTPPAGASNAFWSWVNPPPPAPPTLSVGNSLKANLKVFSDASPNHKVDITADILSVQNVILSTLNLVANAAVNGANGLDVGAQTASTWYAIHVITNASGSLSASLLSLSATAPTLPAGYTLFRRVGWVRSSVSNIFVQFFTTGGTIYYTDPTQTVASSPNGSTSFTSSLPSTCRSGIFNVLLNGNTNSNGGVTWVITGTSNPGILMRATQGGPGVTAGDHTIIGFVSDLPVNTGQSADISAVAMYAYSFTTIGYYDEV